MSGLQSTAATMNARSIEARAVDWLIERDDPSRWTEENETAFEAWLAQSPAHRVAYWRLEAGWSRAEIVGDISSFNTEERNLLRRARNWTNFRRTAAGFAAIALVVTGVAAAYLALPQQQTYATAIGGHRLVKLADGSSIELNTDTVLRVSTSANARRVTLVKGEAFFNVRHDAARAFTVDAAGHRVTDLGTKFLARTEGERLEVALVEGRARVDENDGSHSATLTPGDVAVATPNAMSVTKTPVQVLANDLAWRHGVLVFEDTTLADAALEFNRYNSQKIVIADQHSARLKISGILKVNDLAEFTRMARNFFDLRADRRGNDIVISR